jgi:hypothetical protein
MSTTVEAKTTIPATLDARVLARTFEEGWGPGAWHGADLRAALDEVPAELAFWRPAAGRHNIAEVALHHAWCTRNVRAQVSGEKAEEFPLAGEDWFAVEKGGALTWPKIRALVEKEQKRLGAVLDEAAAGRRKLALDGAAAFELVLGVTCHAVYHAGQVQLVKRLHEG